MITYSGPFVVVMSYMSEFIGERTNTSNMGLYSMGETMLRVSAISNTIWNKRWTKASELKILYISLFLYFDEFYHNNWKYANHMPRG